ncbi:hypothetical protein K1T71_009420 [Dendrolimus kikuchii]|uniref:Uncharacterized protein n=1 Tax=Dendrolimus kikuchii TaxID=765133 RepID=A0ACC1CUC8_9NEOP|nr:hypothetical protein K1T71_009420 [Dendrolimus kikuchii]
MLFKGGLILLYVSHCVALETLEIIPEIFLKLNCIKERNHELWIEEPIKAGKREDGSFVLLEHQPAVIKILMCEHAKYPVDLLHGEKNVQETKIFYSIRSPKGTVQWYFKFQIPTIVDSMHRTWPLDLYSRTSAKLKIHIRPSKLVPIVLSEGTSLTTQISSYSITEFDAFGCLIYNKNAFLNLTCKSTQKCHGFYTMYWKASGIADTHSLIMPDSRIKAYYINQVKLEDGAYLDCIEDFDKDYINVRIFLIHNKTEMTNDNSPLSSASLTYKPISSDDREGCLEYVNYYLHKSKSENSNEDVSIQSSELDITKWIVIFGVVLIFVFAIVIAFGFFNKKCCDWIHNQKKSNSANNVQRRPSAEHVYCYIEARRRESQVELPKSTSTDNTGAVVENEEQRLREIPNTTGANPTTSPYIANQENDELIYTYAYADRFCIMEALRMQNQ